MDSLAGHLVRYDAARTALAEAHRVDEVKDIRDKAQAMAAYARQAKDTAMVEWATEIKVRAERRAGELLRETADSGQRATRSRGGANIPTVSHDATPTLDAIGITRSQSSRWQKLAAIPEAKFEQAVAAAKETAREVTTAAMLRLDQPHVTHNSGENEWYTPPEFIEAARAVMRGIDLDPASSEIANRTVKAERFFTPQDDGLAQKWNGRVWMNPPYGTSLIGKFANAAVEKFAAGEFSEACILVNNGTETAWFQALLGASSALCFPQGRIRFWRTSGESLSPLQGQAIFYLGPFPDDFCSVFSHFGWVGKHG